MPKVFELDNALEPGTPDTCWHRSPEWDDTRAESIVDNAERTNQEITSYPSPLARMHLFRDAFSWKARPENLLGNTGSLYDRAVSQCLDVWELMFQYRLHAVDGKPGGLDFIEWPFSHIRALTNSTNESFRLLGTTLQLYLENDQVLQTNGKPCISRLFLLRYNGKVFAGTSPFTGFFTTANRIESHIEASGSRQLFSDVCPLHQRPKEFQEYLHLVARTQGISQYFKAFYSYIFSLREHTEHQSIRDIWTDTTLDTKAFAERYPEMVATSKGMELKLLDAITLDTSQPDQTGIRLRCNRPSVDTSDFLLRFNASKKPALDRVLVLKSRPEGADKYYYNQKAWPTNTNVPHFDPRPIDQRTLPGENLRFPYLTTSDLLEEYLIRVPYAVNSGCFITGTDSDCPFLLPVKPLFFNYFTVDDLRKMARMEFPNGVTDRADFSLEIPIGNNETLTLKRSYRYHNPPHTIQAIHESDDGAGTILNYGLGLLLFPFLRMSTPQYNDFYRVGCIDGNYRDGTSVQLRFMEQGEWLPELGKNNPRGVHKETRVKKTSVKEGTDYYVLEGIGFDAIHVEVKPMGDVIASGLVVPAWEEKQVGNHPFDFALDFGTTGSHVAYREDDAQPKAFNVTTADIQVARLDAIPETGLAGTLATTLYDTTHEGSDIFVRTVVRKQRHDFIPSILGETYRFPIRTALLQSSGISDAAELRLLGNANIPFAFNLRFQEPNGWEVHTNLKWMAHDSVGVEAERVRIFIRQLLYQIRTKVLMNGGNPAETRIWWFSPHSLPNHIRATLSELWNTEYRDIFHTGLSALHMTESEAPIYHHLAQVAFQGNSILSIDIGGGTTDILVYGQNGPVLGSSCTFAGNAVFGNGFDARTGVKTNGIVSMYQRELSELLENRINTAGISQTDKLMVEELKKTLDWFFRNEKIGSDDIASFFFSVEEFKFSDRLKSNQSLKLVFLLHFMAIHYHCAQVLRDRELEPPTDICMSGTGSKLLQLVSADTNLLGSLMTGIYQGVLGVEIDRPLLLHTLKDPKEATCNGALQHNQRQEKQVPRAMILGERLQWPNNAAPEPKITYADLQGVTVDEENSEYLTFLSLFFDLWDTLDFENNFGLSFHKDKLHEYLKSTVQTGLNRGLWRAKQLGNKDQEELSETVFFYPLIEAIHGKKGLLDRIAKYHLGQTKEPPFQG